MTVKISEMTVTWNDAGTVLSAIRMNVTDTASAAGSRLLDLRRNGEPRLAVTKERVLRLFNAHTDDANYEAGVLKWDDNAFVIGMERAGTGSSRNVRLENGSGLAYVQLNASSSSIDLNWHNQQICLRYRGTSHYEFNNTTGFYSTQKHTLGESGNPWGAFFIGERNSDPGDPPEGVSVLWQSDGTATGADGDVLLKSTAGGVTRTVNLFDAAADIDLSNMTVTWNDAGTTFSAIKMNVSNTDSAAGSKLLDLQLNGTSRFSVDKFGSVILDNALAVGGVSYFRNNATFTNSAGNQFRAHVGNTITLLQNIGYFGFSPTGSFTDADVRLYRDAANTLAQRNGTNAQSFNLYNTYTDASNYERGFMRWNSNVLEIGAEAAGTGTIRTMRLGTVSAGLTLPLGGGTVAKATLEARDGIFLRTLNVNRIFLSEGGADHANFYPTSDGTVALGFQNSNLGWTQVAFREVSTDPGDPDEGQSVLWQSDGTGTGDDGDILMKVTAGGVTKTATLVDFSAL